ALMSIDDVNRTPIPFLHVDLAQAVLVITANDQLAILADHLRGHIQRKLQAGHLHDAVAAAAVGVLNNFVGIAPPVLGIEADGCSQFFRQFAHLFATRDSDHPGTGSDCQLHQQQTQKSGTDDGDSLIRTYFGTSKDNLRAADVLAVKGDYVYSYQHHL